MKSKIVVGFIILVILIAVISIFTYKLLGNGNININQSEEDIVKYILNINSYKAKLEVEVETNKNKSKYVISQSLGANNVSRQEVLEPSNIAGVVTEYDGNNLKIINNKLNLSTTFENYSYVVENKLWLNSFIEDYKKYSNSNVINKENEIILEVKDEEANKYNTYKKLYIDRKTKKPTKMIVQDINQKTLVYILYTEIEIS